MYGIYTDSARILQGFTDNLGTAETAAKLASRCAASAYINSRDSPYAFLDPDSPARPAGPAGPSDGLS